MATSDHTRPSALDEVLSWLDTLDPVQRARFLGVLLDGRNAPQLSSRRAAAIYEATRTRTYAEVAEELGVSTSALNKAVTQHKAVLAGGAAGRDRGERIVDDKR